jgi:hypothetical protein
VTTFATTRALAKVAGRDKITVDGVDVTDFRDKHTPFPTLSLAEPFAYGAIVLTFPQIHATFEADNFGTGELSWVREGARVVISREFDSGPDVIDYVGVVLSVPVDGRALNLEVGGEFSGRAASLEMKTPLARSMIDVGHWAQQAILAANLSFVDGYGPTTGIKIAPQGGQSLLAWTQYVCTMSQDDDGTQRALMPSTWGARTWTFAEKDTTTVDLTGFPDDARVALRVTRDATEQPNVWYGSGISPEGVRWQNSKYPGVFQGTPAPYPMSGGAPFGSGTTDADTINDDGISTLQINLEQRGYMPFATPPTSTYNAAMVKAVKLLQADARLSETGTMTTDAWDALFDLSVTGYDLNGAKIFPLISDPRVEKFIYSSTGAVIGRNPAFDPRVLRVERVIDFGPGVDKATGRAWCRGQQARALRKNWTGTIELGNGVGLWAGDHATPTGLTEANIVAQRDIRPGMNVRIPYFDNDTLFHIAGVEQRADGATLTVDTQARDLMELREIIDRNRESRRDVRREWMSQNRPGKHSGNMVVRDEHFGILHNDVTLHGNRWNVIPFIVGQSGQVNRVKIHLVNDQAAFAVAAFATRVTERRLNRRVGNPLTVTGGESAWEKASLQDWFDNRVLLYSAGDENQPCGYFPRRFKNDSGNATGAPITGRHFDDEPWPYECAPGTAAIIYVAIWPDRDCTLKRGQILWPQLDDAV